MPERAPTDPASRLGAEITRILSEIDLERDQIDVEQARLDSRRKLVVFREALLERPLTEKETQEQRTEASLVGGLSNKLQLLQRRARAVRRARLQVEPFTRRKLPADPGDRLRLIARDVFKIPPPPPPPEADEEVFTEELPPTVGEPTSTEGARLETRVRSSAVVVQGNRTPCTARGFIRRRGVVQIKEALLAAASAYQDAAKSGLQGLAPMPWRGNKTVTGACGNDIAQLIQAWVSDPKGAQRLVVELAKETGVRMALELTVSWREIVTVRTRTGNLVERATVLPGLPQVRVAIGERIREPEGGSVF